MSEPYNNTDLQINCCANKIYKHISYLRIKTEKIRLSTFQQRHRLRQTKDKFREHANNNKKGLTHVVGKTTLCVSAWDLVKISSILWLRP